MEPAWINGVAIFRKQNISSRHRGIHRFHASVVLWPRNKRIYLYIGISLRAHVESNDDIDCSPLEDCFPLCSSRLADRALYLADSLLRDSLYL